MLVSMQDLLRALAERRLTLAVAEGDTGGLLLERLTAVPGSSAVVLGGVVAYADTLKCQLLQVTPELLREHGAVSAEAARAMAAGVRQLAGADIGLATTGIAGPGGQTSTKPVGLAYVAAATAEAVLVREHHWHGDRHSNRQSSAMAAVALLEELLP
jgi:PncC family amidohydrolase